MKTSLATYATGRDNNFNLIRFVAATLVLVSHSFALAIGTADAEPLRSSLGMTWGLIAVDIFFITSGFLITGSYFSRNNLLAFVWARVLRIYPALIVAIIFCVFVVGLFFTTVSPGAYLFDTQTLKFLIKNTTLFLGIEYSLPGVFLDVPYERAVNGSLWTLPYEVRMYAILACVLVGVAYVGRRFRFVTAETVVLLLACGSVALNLLNHFQPLLPEQFVRLFSMFFVGAAFFVWRDKVYLSAKWIYLVLAVLLLSAFDQSLFVVAYSLLLPFLVFNVAYVPSGRVRHFNRFGDYSYGMYIYAFPVQQSLAALIPGISVLTMIVASFFITLALSVFSWHLIEKKCLSMKGSYLRFERFLQSRRVARPNRL